MIKLCKAEIGGQYRILKMAVPEDTGRRLRALGMTQETSVNVLNRKKNGCLIEGMACPGGCVAGAGTNIAVPAAARAVGSFKSAAKKKIPDQK